MRVPAPLGVKKEARAALENAEAEKQRLHSEMLALKKGFWEEYYGNGQGTLTEVGPELRALETAVKEAEKSLKRARAKFEEADFDEVAERSALIAEANAVEEEANRRLEALERTLMDLIDRLGEDLKEASRALHDECQDVQGEEAGTPKSAGGPRRFPRPPRGRRIARMERLLAKATTAREPRGRNLPVAALLVLAGLFCLWVGLVEIKGKVPLALMLVGIGLANAAMGMLYGLPTDRPQVPTRAWMAGISLALVAIGIAAWRLLI